MSAGQPRISISFLYAYTTDLAETRRFYTELVGMEEVAFKPEWNWLCYQCEGFQYMFFGAPEGYEPPTEFAVQPGWEGGELVMPSWSITVPSEDFPAVVECLRAADVKRFFDKPAWCRDSYWSFPVLDPAGMTIEVCNTPKERPASTEWPD